MTSDNWPSGKDDRLVIWRPCGVGGSNPAVDKIFCNVHLFRVPLSWTGSVRMKSSMTFIRGNRCIEREEDIFKFGREVKRLKKCALALSNKVTHYIFITAKNPRYSPNLLNCTPGGGPKEQEMHKQMRQGAEQLQKELR